MAVKEARQQNDLNQNELTKILHITPQHLRAIENGRQKPSYDLLCSLVHKLAISVDEALCPDMPHDREELEKVLTLLHFCDNKELSIVSAVLHAIMKYKQPS
jgi:transcriptional regulator with XRE-family HTH domain